jgi:polyisoprenoid-binding protein YceI
MSKSYPLFLLSCLLTLCSVGPVYAETYVFNEKHSKVGFEIGHLTGTANGQFRKIDGTLEFDPNKPEASKVRVTLQVDSIDTGSAKRDSHLQEDDYFFASQHPTITFESVGFRKRGSNQYVVTGPLTIRGIEKNITLYVTLEGSQQQWAVPGKALLFASDYELNRLDFGVSGGRPAVGDRVTINLDIKAFEKVR